jgi:hypothetical protein
MKILKKDRTQLLFKKIKKQNFIKKFEKIYMDHQLVDCMKKIKFVKLKFIEIEKDALNISEIY